MSLALLRIQLETLHRFDTHGRMLCENEPGDPSAPRLSFGRTVEGNAWAIRYDLSDELARTLDELCRAEPVVVDFDEPLRYAAAIRSLLGPESSEWRGPAYVCPEILPTLPGAVVLSADGIAALSAHFGELIAEEQERAPIAAILQNGIAVAACWCSRRTARAAEAGIETIPAYRGRGHAAACAVAWAAAVRAGGRLPLYSTSWENLASRAIARRIGATMYAENWSIQ